MKRIKCKACGRPRWARPAPGPADVRMRQTVNGREVRVSALDAKQPDCLYGMH